jgi:hypothetical protein
MKTPWHIGDAIGGALAIAAVSTLGDYLWANFLPHHRPIYGLTHGTLLFLAVGLYLGVLAHKAAIGAVAGGLLGFLAAANFYVLSPILGYSPMFLLYIGVWLGLGLLNGRMLRPARRPNGRPEFLRYDRRRTSGRPEGLPDDSSSAYLPLRPRGGFGEVLIRSILAAVGSGIGFYAISGIWFPFNPRGWDYAVHFAAWTVAYFPAFAALLVRRDRP